MGLSENSDMLLAHAQELCWLNREITLSASPSLCVCMHVHACVRTCMHSLLTGELWNS